MEKNTKIKILTMALLLIFCCLLTYYFHVMLGTKTVFTHFFYVPIFLAAFWWKRKGIIVALFLAALLIISHNYLSSDASYNDYFRAGMFIIVGVVFVVLIERIAKSEEELLAHREHLELINQILRHDILNNLAAINSAVRLYKKSNEKELLEEANSSIEKSVNLIRRMNDLESFISSHKDLKLYNITDVIREVTENYKSTELTIKGKGDVLADEALSSVCDNIIKNAVVHGKTDRIDISIKEKGEFSEIRIADYGVGIPDEMKEKVFEKSFVYGKTGHTGLGLYIVKKNMERYGGDVHVEDNTPKGTVFVLRLRRMK